MTQKLLFSSMVSFYLEGCTFVCTGRTFVSTICSVFYEGHPEIIPWKSFSTAVYNYIKNLHLFRKRRIKMSDMMENKMNAEELNEVTGGVGRQEINVRAITPIWVMVTASSLNCRYTPNGPIAKTYEYGHKLKVDGITDDGEWYRLLINDPRGGTCYAFIYKQYTKKF